MVVRLSRKFKSMILLFVFRAIFGCQFSMNPSTKRCSSIFDLRPITPKIYSPKFDQKSTITRLVWQIHHRCLRLIGGFRGCPFNGTIQNVVGPTPVAMATKFARKSPITRLVRHIGRRCFSLIWDFRGRPIQCNHAKSCTADPCCYGNDICARRGV